MNIEEFNNFLCAETAWRKKELVYLNSLIADKVSCEKEILLKYSILALYSHFEGFYKTAIFKYIDFVLSHDLLLSQINISLLTVIIRKQYELQKIRSFEKDKELIEELLKINRIGQFEVKEIEKIKDFEGNLNQKNLISFLNKIGIEDKNLLNKTIKANWLVGLRNQIAHGSNFSVAYDQFLELKKYVEEMITLFAEILSSKSVEFE
jgi:hypothetical protein